MKAENQQDELLKISLNRKNLQNDMLMIWEKVEKCRRIRSTRIDFEIHYTRLWNDNFLYLVVPVHENNPTVIPPCPLLTFLIYTYSS